MFKLSDDFYLRKCFFKKEQVPTQTVMKAKMNPALANVYFKSMTPKLKVLAGLEPPMKGGGSDWYQPPEELLKGRAVMKPIKKQFISKLSYLGIDSFGNNLVENHNKRMEEERNKALLDSDKSWKEIVEIKCRQQWENSSKEAAKQNTQRLHQAFNEFTSLYMTSINKLQEILLNAGIKEIKRVREETFQKMSAKYETLLKQQAIALYDEYTEKLEKEKARLKAEFIENIEINRTDMSNKLHDINVEKHTAVEKLRNLLECQNLACQVYVALKEKEECEREMELSKHKHEKQVKKMKEEIQLKDFEIRLEMKKEKKRTEFNRIWQKKVCHVVKQFQRFVSYCLSSFPEHAEFFINMEKLMLLQVNEAVDEPSADTIFEAEEENLHTPVPRPHPFFLFCDKSCKPDIDPNLCPKRYTSSASQLPLIVVNKRCIYSVCDNFTIFTDKIKQYIHGRRGDDIDFEDDHDYTYNVPIKYTTSKQLLELKLESSLMQVLQKELPNVKQVPIECCVCKIPHCFCNPLHASDMSLNVQKEANKEIPREPIPVGNKIETRSVELAHEREPKMASYMSYVKPKCKCPKTAKKHLNEHLPAYMQKMSTFDAADLPNYKTCSLDILKKLVKRAKGIHTPAPTPPPEEPKTRDVSTEYSDQEFDYLCTCFSDDEINKLFKVITTDVCDGGFEVVDGKIPSIHLSQHTSSFATKRAYSLRNLLKDAPDLEEIFKKEDCNFD